MLFVASDFCAQMCRTSRIEKSSKSRRGFVSLPVSTVALDDEVVVADVVVPFFGPSIDSAAFEISSQRLFASVVEFLSG